MTPIEFVVFNGDSEPNQPACQVAEAMSRDIVVHGPDGEYEVLSYYRDGPHMVLEVRRKETDFSHIDRNTLLQELLPEVEKLFNLKYKQLEKKEDV